MVGCQGCVRMHAFLSLDKEIEKAEIAKCLKKLKTGGSDVVVSELLKSIESQYKERLPTINRNSAVDRIRLR